MNWILMALLAACIARLWIAPLHSSFWVDEMGTSFVVHYGADDPTLRVAPQVPASIYYLLPRLAQFLGGLSEIAYRIPSVLAMGLGLFFIACIARRLIHPDAGWFAVFACLLLRDFNFQAADARPYALATCVAAASFWFLIRWFDSGKWLDALWFIVAAALIWRVHLILWPAYVICAVYAIVRLATKDTQVSWIKAAGVFAIVGVTLLPVLAGALSLYREAGAHVVARLPGSDEFYKSLKLEYVTGLVAITALIARWRRWARIGEIASWDAIAMIFGWWLLVPLCLFVFSRVTGNSVFVSRYLYLALPGLVLSAMIAVAAFVPASYWKPLAATMGLAILIFMGRWNRPALAHSRSDWRGAALRFNQESFGPNVPVLCPSPFIEARPPVWRPDYPTSSFLYSHLLVYKILGREYPFPFETSPQAELYAAELAKDTLSPAGRFALYGADNSVWFWRDWFGARPEFAGWSMKRLGPFGDVEAIVFEKPPEKAAYAR